MTTQPPATIADCTALASEALAALVDSGLTPDQKQHVGTLVNAYIYAYSRRPHDPDPRPPMPR